MTPMFKPQDCRGASGSLVIVLAAQDHARLPTSGDAIIFPEAQVDHESPRDKS
jgi:hypothetical protein